MILGIETATAVCAAAVVGGGRVFAESAREEKYIHAERLMSMVDEVLRRSGCSLASLDAIAVSIGPGSFTGLRIGLSVAKGLAYAVEKPLIAVPTLRAIAERAARENGDDAPPAILPLLDARKDEVYCQLFERHGSTVRPAEEEHDVKLTVLAERLSQMEVLITGEAAPRLRELMMAPDGRNRPEAVFADTEKARCSAAVVALIGERMLGEGNTAEARDLEPRYIKEFFLKTKG
jgi:tRNA threonylcarbamoyladenosine biosynthesis protein TsaB